MGTGAAEGPGRGGSRVKMVRQYEQHEERPRGRRWGQSHNRNCNEGQGAAV